MGLREDLTSALQPAAFRGDYARVTAADRPGIAQPVPQRDVPRQPWRTIVIVAALSFAVMLGAWEWHWRAFGAAPETRNSDGLWAAQRRRIDAGEGDATVLIGSSRTLYDTQLDVWEKFDGRRPIQLAFEGTTPLPFLEDLADDANFSGRLIVGIAPDVFFSGFAKRGAALDAYRHETPAQRIGQWLSLHFVEPGFAFYQPDFALATVLKRQSWPLRPGRNWGLAVRKLSVTAEDRDTHLWEKIETDAGYRALTRTIWLQEFEPDADDPTPAERRRTMDEQIERAAAATAKLRARAVEVIFVRPPSSGPYLDFENRNYPRAASWDILLARCGAPGVHFEDHPELQGLDLPEWSHLSRADARRYTENLHRIIRRDVEHRDVGRAGPSDRLPAR